MRPSCCEPTLCTVNVAEQPGDKYEVHLTPVSRGRELSAFSISDTEDGDKILLQKVNHIVTLIESGCLLNVLVR
jgi:hypothetical protein